jgi:MFS family permease
LLSKAIRILRRKSGLSLSIMGILVMFAFRGIQIFVPILGSELNMSLSLIGLILGARTVGSTAARIPAGYLSQYSGRKNLLFLSLLFIISSYFLLSFFSSLEFILLSVCLEGIGFGIFFTITQSFLMSISKKSERATTFALFSLVGWPLQTGLLMVLGFVGELVELSVIFLIGAIVTSLLGLASSYLLYRSDDD